MTVLSVALSGFTVAVSVSDFSTSKVSEVLLRVMLVTLIMGSVTVTAQVAVTPLPSLAVQVIVALPLALAVTLPLSTVTTLSLLDDHVTV